MRSLLCLATSLLVILWGCKQQRDATVARDACSLISKQEIESVQNAPVKEAKSSEHLDGTFRVSQCLYTADTTAPTISGEGSDATIECPATPSFTAPTASAEFSKSVSLALIQPDQKQRGARTPRDFWKEKFDPYQDEEPKTKSGDEKEQASAPKKIEGLGGNAYWVGNRFGGMLYVLKGDAFISISVGGTDDEGTKLKKSKALAEKALQRL